ncbi:MAG: hypothetical protein BWZ05_01389 [Bacteroidetes bacterium ADurb.BinA245]|jgi:hypothetical protein|nr:MAG: hypothetical protein BWZ05_01389 [Bacteroidetes bacterium ADurb.BinA245]
MGTSPFALVKDKEIAFFLQEDKKTAPEASSSIAKILIRIFCVVVPDPTELMSGI